MRTGRRVLLVDEDPMRRLAVDRQLNALGWDSLAVNNGREALRVIELGLIVDGLVIDVRLPDLDGPAVAAAIARLLPRVRVVFMDDAPPPASSAAPSAPWLVRPFSTPALGVALDAAARLEW